MNIIKLDAIDSTNSYLKKIILEKDISDYTIVTANFQTEGKGQLGYMWESEDSKNLLCSIYKKDLGIKVEDQFVLSMLVSLSIIRTLEKLNLPKLYVKWPNDIMSDNKKICGILIENMIKQNSIKESVIGIGLNVNQDTFKNLPNATSIKKIKGVAFNIDKLLNDLVNNIKKQFIDFNQSKIDLVFRQYEDVLYRINIPSTFKNSEGDVFTGFIKGVNNLGRLKVLLEDNLTKSYSIKDILLLN
ncbi:MAG: biotin--[acetyl-CoA-carboxylase] ligase [Bacteroidota bacterium]|nr:biotin--[acetyl-CoA-carboxylase] ligase [Bacteroidota bacterium]